RTRPGTLARRLPMAALLALALGAAVAAPASAAWPVASRSSYVSQYFHRGHPADDIAAARGTRIVPVLSGRVVFAGWKAKRGRYQVWVAHGDGLYTAYYHMRREVSWRGRWVSRGSSTLGYVGATGCATGPHTHVEVWHGYPWHSGSYRVNPWRYIDSGIY